MAPSKSLNCAPRTRDEHAARVREQTVRGVAVSVSLCSTMQQATRGVASRPCGDKERSRLYPSVAYIATIAVPASSPGGRWARKQEHPAPLVRSLRAIPGGFGQGPDTGEHGAGNETQGAMGTAQSTSRELALVQNKHM